MRLSGNAAKFLLTNPPAKGQRLYYKPCGHLQNVIFVLDALTNPERVRSVILSGMALDMGLARIHQLHHPRFRIKFPEIQISTLNRLNSFCQLTP